jgi:RNA polymerase sigma factor (TIGR02999 family)
MSDSARFPNTPTRLLLEWGQGDDRAREQILPLVYAELRRIAARYLRRERPDHTLQPTALVHEAYIRLIDQRHVDWRNRAQFIGLAAMMMRRVLANHARARAAVKRAGPVACVTGAIQPGQDQEQTLDLVALHHALDQLSALDARKSRIVELKFFGGLTTAEISEVTGLSPATVERDWNFARAWLYEAVSTGGG